MDHEIYAQLLHFVGQEKFKNQSPRHQVNRHKSHAPYPSLSRHSLHGFQAIESYLHFSSLDQAIISRPALKLFNPVEYKNPKN